MLEFLFTKTLGKLVASLALIGALFGWWQWDRAHQRQVGALKERVEQAEREHADIERADEVRRASERARAERLRGVVADPYAEYPRRER